MARIRSIKPQFFRHRALYLAEVETGLPLRIAFAGLWTCADREGRFRWEPEELKLDCLPYDQVDFSRVLDALGTRGFITRFTSDDREIGIIPGFSEHQAINNREAPSALPEPPENPRKIKYVSSREDRVEDALITREPRVTEESKGKGREGKGNGREGEVRASLRDGADAPLRMSEDEKTTLYKRGKDVLGPKAGGLITKLLQRNGNALNKARAAVETAADKADPIEYFSAIVRNAEKPANGEYGVDWW